MLNTPHNPLAPPDGEYDMIMDQPDGGKTAWHIYVGRGELWFEDSWGTRHLEAAHQPDDKMRTIHDWHFTNNVFLPIAQEQPQ